MNRSATLLLASALLALPAAPGSAQTTCGSMEECPALVSSGQDVRGELIMAGMNALLGGLTGAAHRAVAGEAVWDGFWQGAVGGGLVYAGKRVAVEPFGGAGLVGRQVASVGGSVIRNASAGRGMWDELVLPAGPVRFYVGAGGVTARVDLATVVVSGAFMVVHGARLDPMASLSSGAMIFRGETPMPGLTSAGASVVWRDIPAGEGPRLMAHERVHILQYDQAFLSWGEGLERWAAGQVPGVGTFGANVLRHVDFGAGALGIRTGLALALDYRARPWEREAYFLAQRAHPLPAGVGPSLHDHGH